MDKKNINNILSFVVIVIIGVITVYILSLIPSSNSTPTTATIPPVTVPSSTVATASTTLPVITSTTPLLSNSQNVPSDILTNLDTYNQYAIRLILNGKFKVAQLHVTGTVNESGNHFVYFSYGTTGGVLYAARASVNSLDINLTNNLGGVFTNQEPMDFTVNLLASTTIAASQNEFLLNRLPTESVNFWDSNILPPTVNSFVVAPFNQKGIVGGVTINSIDFQYACADSSSCYVNTCPSGTLATVCLKNDVNIDAARNWCNQAQLPECKNL